MVSSLLAVLGLAIMAVAPSQSRAANLTTLVNFNGPDGANPDAGLITDANGNLFGTTANGGAAGGGTVFEIAKTAGGYASTPTTLVSLNPVTDGQNPVAGLIADTNGNLFGTTVGLVYDGLHGTAFEIAKTGGGASTLVSFTGTDGALPFAGLIADANGNLFGTTNGGGANNSGTVFEIFKTAGGYASTPTTLVSFNGTDGAGPYAGLIADANGNLFGTTGYGGASGFSPPDQYGYGTVFEITGSGFIPPGVFAGTPGKSNCFGKSVSAMARQYGGLNAAAAAFGFASVGALQNAMLMFCGG
jgi:uncharacterized repeat protein (TIGR03803 family)